MFIYRSSSRIFFYRAKQTLYSPRVLYNLRRFSDFPDFKGKVIKRGDNDYEAQCYQYASSSYLKEAIIQPAAIIKAADDSDVIKAIKYASDNKIAVAVRTGGHQYSGASSTNGNNIQLDLSQTYKDFTWDNSDCTSVTLGISFKLGDFNAKLGEKNRFVPHGQCQFVNVGGHVQTGGYGQLARSFGLLADHVKKFRIITADGQARWVVRNFRQDEDLFFAVMGGSPGNFGVLTHITLNVFKDQDYPNSRGLRAIYPYNPKSVKKLLDVMVEMTEDENFPADYDYTITVLDESIFTFDTYDKKYDTKDTLASVIWAPVIIVFAQWANLQGAQQIYNPNFIDKIKQAGGPIGLIRVSDEEHTPLSTLTRHWTFPIEREFKLPYVKRVYMSNSSSQRLKDHKWTNWVSDRIENASPRTLDLEWDLHLSVQIQPYGGFNSRFFQNGRNSPTSHSWRDTNIVCVLDAFYHDASEQQERAKKWQQENDEGVGKPEAPFCEYDRRVLWGSHDLDLSANQQYYYDQNPEGKYERLCEIKKKYDPLGVFTPNRFCIGLPPVDSHRSMFVDSKAAKKEPAKILRVEPQLSAEEKFLKMVNMKREDGKPVPLWDTWGA